MSELVGFPHVSITGTTMRQKVFNKWRIAGGGGDQLTLEPDFEQWEVRVMFGADQMGWIGEKHKTAVFDWLKSYGRSHLHLQLSVTRFAPDDPDNNRLTVAIRPVERPTSSDPKTSLPLRTVKVFGPPTGGPMLREFLHLMPVGAVLDCFTREGRSSIDIRYMGNNIAWFRKEEDGNSNDLTNQQIMWANRGALICRVESQNPTQISLHQKGTIRSEFYTGPLAEPVSNLAEQAAASATWSQTNTQTTPTQKGNTMQISSIFSNLFNLNRKAAADAAYLETGRIANKTVVRILVGRLPFLARFYAKTPLGSLVVANAGILLAQQLRPNDVRLQKLAGAMTTSAYQELIQMIDPESFVDQLLAEPSIKRALDKAEENFNAKADE